MVPSGNKLPGTFEAVKTTPGQLSEAEGAVQFTIAPQAFTSALTTILLGTPVIFGVIVSNT